LSLLSVFPQAPAPVQHPKPVETRDRRMKS
jgi:hypothetical protein